MMCRGSIAVLLTTAVATLAAAAAACGSKPPAPPIAPPAPKPGPAPEGQPPTTDPETGATDEVIIMGQVRGIDGEPAEGAVVALVAEDNPVAFAVMKTRALGYFFFRAPPGRYGITVTSPFGLADYEDVRDYTEPSTEVALRLGSGGTAIHFIVTSPNGPVPRDTRIVLARHSDSTGDLFYTTAGLLVVWLPDAEYTIWMEDDVHVAEPMRIDTTEAGYLPTIVMEAWRKDFAPGFGLACIKGATLAIGYRVLTPAP
jgi:hypothetical protein